MCVAAISAQEPPPTFRSAADLVEVDVRVFDKDGRFVTGLSGDDFTLAEDGTPQKIVNATLISGAPAPGVPTAPTAVTTTAAGPPVTPPAVWLFVFDTPHLSASTLPRARDAVIRFIAEKFRSGDIGGVVVNGRMVNNRLTSDREELRKSAADARFPGEVRSRQLELREWPRLRDPIEAFGIVRGDRDALQAAVTRACNEDPDACKRASPEPQVQEKAQRMVAEYRAAAQATLGVVRALSKGLARMPGTKTVVFLSEGFVQEEMDGDLRVAAGEAARAGAHVYTVDVRGLNRGMTSGLIEQKLADDPAGAGARFDAQEDGTNSLAIDTGGLAIRNQNDLARALEAIQRDAATYYVLAYRPANGTMDGKYRRISVTVDRPDLRVRARRGYLAVAPAKLLLPRPESVTVTVPAAESVTVTVPGAAAGGSVVPRPSANAADAVRSKIEAGRIVQQLRGADEGSPASAAERGWAAYQRGDVDTSSRELLDAAKAPGAPPWVHYALGLSQLALQRYREAGQSWERVRAAAPAFEPVYFNLADAYLLQHEDGAAIGVLRDAEQRWHADPEIANAIGVIQVRRGALDAAIESFERATKIAPDDPLAYFNLGRALQMRMTKSQRYVREMTKWIGGDEDRRRATAAFERYVQLGGPFVPQAREALSALAWK